MNALSRLRMLTATEQNHSISHASQIAKNQEESGQNADHGYQLNIILFINDI